ncbi:MAG: hypothetical protein J6A75_10185 [Lachnospiraceae bacterium]|nr:hypothetical protein [Lachnospiraceae bacterium]
MYDFQITVLLEARPDKQTLMLRYASLAVAALGLLACIWINPLLWALPAALVIFWWWRMWFHTNMEYEYLYFDGTIDIDKVIDKRKRKSIMSFHMNDVIQIAPVGDSLLESAHQNPKTKYMDLSSRKSNRRVYEIVLQEAGETTCIRFEPDDRFLDGISVKYGRKVKR